jgi:multidrug efflux system membrane fusion protein
VKQSSLWVAGIAVIAAAAGGAYYFNVAGHDAQANAPAAQAPQAVPVSVAVVEQRDVSIWDEFSGRLEAVERVEVR